MLRKIILKIEKWLVTRKLHPEYIYKNSKDGLILQYSKEDNCIRVFIQGLLLVIPLPDYQLNENNVRGYLEEMADKTLDAAPTDYLKALLKQEEAQENYEKCEEIRSILLSRKNEEAN